VKRRRDDGANGAAERAPDQVAARTIPIGPIRARIIRRWRDHQLQAGRRSGGEGTQDKGQARLRRPA
jgi:hypothetical protein